MEHSPFQLVTNQNVGEVTSGPEDNLLFDTASAFSHFIEKWAYDNDKTCTDVILEYCDSKDLDPQDVARLISPSLKGKIHMEMIESGLMAEHNTLE